MRDDIFLASFTSPAGETVSWGVDGAHILRSIGGISGLTSEVATSRTPGQDGETWLAARLPMRLVTLDCALCEASGGADRAQLMRVCDARAAPGMLAVTAYGRTRRIPAYVDMAPAIIEDTSLDWLSYQVSFSCPSPFWQSMEDMSMELATTSGGLRWPLKLPARFALVAATRQHIVSNPGTAVCPVSMEFAGGAINPTLTNVTTGETLRVRRQVPASATLVIDTTLGHKRAYLRDNETGAITDAMGYLDLNSVFWSLQPGDNSVAYDADDGAQAARVSIRWRPLFNSF